MNASSANAQPSGASAAWGPPANPNFQRADVMFRSLVLPALATDYPSMVDLHRQLDQADPIPASVVTEYLNQLRALGQQRPSFAWAAANVALESAVINNHVGVVQALLSVPNWELSFLRNALTHAFHCDEHPGLLQLLVSDVRFAKPSLWWFISPFMLLGAPGIERAQDRIHRLLSSGRFPPKLAWGHVMNMAMSMACQDWDARPYFRSTFPLAGVMDLGQWQFDLTRKPTRNHQQKKSWPVPSLLLQPHTCAKLLVGLPLDLQYTLHNMLDVSTARSLRFTCRALQHFPMDRFAPLRVERELRLLVPESTAESPIQYNPTRIRDTIDSVPGRAGPSTMDYRVLVEAVRHLDVELALKFLCPRPDDSAAGYDLLRARDPASIGYVVSWALFVLLNTFRKQSDHGPAELAKGGLLLQALLLHRLLHNDAWSVTARYYDLCRQLLGAAALDTHANTAARVTHHRSDESATASVVFFIHLIRTGTFLEEIPAGILADVNPSTSSSSFSTGPFTTTHILILLATLSSNPSTFANLLDLLPSPLSFDIEHLMRSIACNRPGSSDTFIPLVFARLPPSTQTYVRNLVVGPLGGGIGRERALNHIAALFTNPHTPWDLLKPADTLSVNQARVNAVLLVHWLRLVAPLVPAPDADGGVDGEAAAQGVDWSEASRRIRACLWVLKRAERYGDQVAIKWHGELSAAWDPVRARIGWWDTAKSGCLVQ